MPDENTMREQLQEISHDVRETKETVIRFEEQLKASKEAYLDLKTRVDSHSERLRKMETGQVANQTKLGMMVAAIAILASAGVQVIVRAMGY